MKKNLIRFFVAAFMLLVYATGNAQTAADPNGVWTFSCPDAPYEYQTGKMEFKKSGDKLTVAVLNNGKAGPANSITKKGKTYSCPITVDGMSLTISFSYEGENLKGYVVGDSWEIPISFKPDKK